MGNSEGRGRLDCPRTRGKRYFTKFQRHPVRSGFIKTITERPDEQGLPGGGENKTPSKKEKFSLRRLQKSDDERREQ